MFTGADAEGFTQAELDAFWTHGEQNTTPVITNYAHGSVMASQADDESGFGIRIAHWGIDAFSTIFCGGHTHATKLGAQFQESHTNFLKRSIQFEDAVWINSDMGVVSNNGEAPDGSQTATKLTADLANATLHQDGNSPAFTTPHTAVIYARRVGGTDVSFDLRLRRVDTSAELAVLNATATDEWQQFSVETQPVINITRVEIEIPGLDDEIEVWEASWWKAKQGQAQHNFPVRTTSATATGLRTEAPMDNPNDQYLRMLRGEIEAISCLGVSSIGSTRGILETTTGAGEVGMFVDITPRLFTLMRDNLGVTKVVFGSDAIADMSIEHKYRMRWESVLDSITPPDTGPENSDNFVDSTRKTGGNGIWNAESPAKSIFFIGSNDTNSGYHKGSMSSLRIFSKPQPV